MKKALLKILLFAFIFAVLSLSLASCGKDKFEIRFVVNGEVYHSIAFSGNGDVEMPEPPTLDGHIFEGWFLDSGKWSVPFDEHYFNDKDYSMDLSIYAKMNFVHEHTPGEYIIQQQATCEYEGLQIKKCTQCDETILSEVIEKAAHEEIIVEGVPATDTTDGYTDGGYCSVCSSITRSQEIIPARIQGTQIGSEKFSIDGLFLSLTVPNSTTDFSILDSLKIYSKAKITLSYDEEGDNPISDSVELIEGDNLFYATVSFANKSQKYTVTIHRRIIFTVSFDTNGGSQIEPISVEEGSLADVSQPIRAGYSFVGWDYDFTKPITENITARAIWTPSSDTAYKIIYYTQKADGEFSVYDEKSYTGTADSTVDAEIITIDGYEYSELISVASGIIAPDGSLVLSVYYVRSYFTVSFDTGCEIEIESQKIKINSKIEEPEEITNGKAIFKGWYLGEELWDFENGTVTENITLSAKWTVKVKFIVNGIQTSVIDAEIGKTIAEPTPPQINRFDFLYWYVEETGKEWDFSEKISEPLRLVAKLEARMPEDEF